jgi:hypothetical protein
LPWSVQEQWCVAVDPEVVSGFQPAAENRRGSWVEADDASTVALAVENGECPSCGVHVIGSQGEGLTCSEAAAVHSDDEGSVPDPGGCPVWASLDQPAYFVGCEDFERVRLSLVRRFAPGVVALLGRRRSHVPYPFIVTLYQIVDLLPRDKRHSLIRLTPPNGSPIQTRYHPRSPEVPSGAIVGATGRMAAHKCRDGRVRLGSRRSVVFESCC